MLFAGKRFDRNLKIRFRLYFLNSGFQRSLSDGPAARMASGLTIRFLRDWLFEKRKSVTEAMNIITLCPGKRRHLRSKNCRRDRHSFYWPARG